MYELLPCTAERENKRARSGRIRNVLLSEKATGGFLVDLLLIFVSGAEVCEVVFGHFSIWDHRKLQAKGDGERWFSDLEMLKIKRVGL